MAELLRDVGKGDVLQATGLRNCCRLKLRGLRLPERGSRMDLFGTQLEPFPLRFAAFEKGLGNGRHTCHGVFSSSALTAPLFFSGGGHKPVRDSRRNSARRLFSRGLADGSVWLFQSSGRQKMPVVMRMLFAVDGHTAKDGGRAVGLDSFLLI